MWALEKERAGATSRHVWSGPWLGVGSIQDTERRAGSVRKIRCTIWSMLNLSCQREISNRMPYWHNFKCHWLLNTMLLNGIIQRYNKQRKKKVSPQTPRKVFVYGVAKRSTNEWDEKDRKRQTKQKQVMVVSTLGTFLQQRVGRTWWLLSSRGKWRS